MSDGGNCPDCEEQAGVIVGLRNHLGFVLDREADTQRHHNAKIEAQAAEIEKLREALVWADLKIRSLPHTDQSDVEPIRAALGETK